MQNGIILYQSKYGATKKYADWLKEATHFDCLETKKAGIQQIEPYDTILLGGGIYASGIAGISFLKKNMPRLQGKKVAIFCVGASPYEEAALQKICEHNLKGELRDVPCFYCRGAWNLEIMSFRDKTLCKMLQKAVAKQDASSYEPWQKALMDAGGQTCDWTDRKYLEPLMEFLKG